MKIRRNGLGPLAAFIVLVCAVALFGQSTEPFSIDKSPLPQPTEPVSDFAGALSDSTKQQLNKKLRDFKARTNPSVEIAVAVVKTTDGRPIADYSLAVARGWKIGSDLDDNPGVLLFVALDDRKYYTQTSRDIEDELPDGVVGSLQRQYLVPAFQQKNYDKGISDTLDAYIRTIDQKTGNVTATPTPNGQKSSAPVYSITSIVCCLVVLIVILVIIFSVARSRGPSRHDRDRWGGGGFGGSGGGWIFFPGGGFGGGGGSSDSSSSWGGSSDWGGGGSSWGGGGGDFGGGGAGGDW